MALKLHKPRRIKTWRATALALYARMFGRRCSRCCQLVNLAHDGVLYDLDGEVLLTHRAPCGRK